MKDIKFRAWDKRHKTMVDCMDWSGPFDNGWPFTDEFTLSRYVFMQYTGRTDWNGKEIYEGDILKCRYMIDYDVFREPEDIVEVVFEDGRFRPMTDIKRNQYSNHPYYYDWHIIGNIHENPELLEK